MILKRPPPHSLLAARTSRPRFTEVVLRRRVRGKSECHSSGPIEGGEATGTSREMSPTDHGICSGERGFVTAKANVVLMEASDGIPRICVLSSCS